MRPTKIERGEPKRISKTYFPNIHYFFILFYTYKNQLRNQQTHKACKSQIIQYIILIKYQITPKRV